MIKSFNKKRYNVNYCTLLAHKFKSIYFSPSSITNYSKLHTCHRSEPFSTFTNSNSSHPALLLKAETLSEETDIFSSLRHALKESNLEKVIEIYNLIPSEILSKIPKDLYCQILSLGKISKSSQKTKFILKTLKDIKSYGIGLEAEAYNALAFTMASSRQYEDCWLLIQEMKRANYKPDTNIISLMILSLSSDGMTKSAFDLFQVTIADLNNKELVELYQAMIVGFKSRKDPENVYYLTLQMLQSGIDIPLTFLKHVLSYLFNCNHYEDATNLFLELLKSNAYNNKLLEDSTIFVFTIKNLVLDHQYAKVVSILEQVFENTNSSIDKIEYSNEIITLIESEKYPHYRQCLASFYDYLFTNTFSSTPPLISALTKFSSPLIPSLFMEKWEQTQVPTSVKLIQESENTSLSSSKLYSSVQTLINRGMILEASNLIERNILNYKSDPYPICNLLIKAYSSTLQEDKVHELISKMEKWQLPPNSLTFELLYKLYKQTGNLSLAKKWYHIQKDQLQLVLSLKSYKYLMSLFSHHDPAFSRDILLDTIDSDTLPTSSLINIALKPFIESSSYELCEGFLTELNSVNVQLFSTNFVYIIGSMVKHGNMKEAEYLLSSMRSKFGLKPNTQLCSILLKGYSTSRDTAGIRRIFDFMIQNSVPLNQVTYSILIQNAVYNQDFGQVENLLKAMHNQGIKPNLITLSCLIGPHIGDKGVEACNAFIETLKEYNLRPDSIIHILLLRSLSSMSNLDDCIKYFRTHWDSITETPEPYSTLLEIGFKNQDTLESILKIHFELMESPKFQVTPQHFEILFRSLIKWEQFEDLLKVIQTYTPFENYFLPPYLRFTLETALTNSHNYSNEDVYNKLKSYV